MYTVITSPIIDCQYNMQVLLANKDALSLLIEATTACGSTHQLDSPLPALDSKVLARVTSTFLSVLQLTMMETFLCPRVETIASLSTQLEANLCAVLDVKAVIQECFRILDTSALIHRVDLL